MSEHPFPMSPIRYGELPTATQDRHAVFVDNFGRWLFSIRNQSLAATRRLVDDETARRALGAVRCKPYGDIAAVAPEQRDAAVALSQAALDGFIERLLWALGDEGVDCRFDEQYAYRFRVQTEIVNASTMEVVEDAAVNRGGPFFGKNWGRWLNRFSGPVS